MTRTEWVERHPYLQDVADVQAQVDRALAGVDVPAGEIPDWNEYGSDYRAGVPWLRSATATIDPGAVQDAVHSLIQALGSSSSTLAAFCRALDGEMTSMTPPGNPGLLRFLGWTVFAQHLRPIVDAFSRWRDEERWLRNYCPTCGEPPAMAQLVGIDPGRLRLLSCGCCGTRWRYRRTACPFCDQQHEHKLTALGIEGEGGLRIDYCDACHGYLKTYAGQGDEAVLLADWTSLHLDVLARNRGLTRRAASLYDL